MKKDWFEMLMEECTAWWRKNGKDFTNAFCLTALLGSIAGYFGIHIDH